MICYYRVQQKHMQILQGIQYIQHHPEKIKGSNASIHTLEMHTATV